MSIAEKVRQVQQGRKGISYHPELDHRVHVLRQGAGEEVNTDLESFIDYATIYGSYVWVHKAVSKIAEAIAPLPVRVVDADGQALDKHPLTELFLHVNDTQGPVQLWSSWVVHMLLAGEEFQEIVPDKNGNPVELWSRRPDKMSVVPDASRPLYPSVAGYVFNHDDKYEAADVIHDKFYNPLSPWRGLPPIAAVRSGITIDLFSQAWAQSFLARGARPDFALIAPDGLTPSEREEYESILEDKHGGPDNWHRPIILEQGVTKIETFSWAPKDIEWLEQRKFSRDEVGGLFGVPDEVMGYGRDTYENMEAAHKWFWLLTLSKLIEHRDTTLTSFFTKTRPVLGLGERVATDLSSVGVLQEDLLPKLELAERLWKMGTPLNMLDERFNLGIGPIPGGDIGYLPSAMYPVGAPRPFGMERMALLEGEAKTILPALMTRSVTVPEYGSPRHKALWKASVARFSPYERRMKAKLLEDLEKVKKETLAALKATWAADKAKKKPGHVPQSVDEFFDLDAWVEYFALAYEQYYSDMMRTAGQAALADLALDMPFDLGAPRVQRAIRAMRIKFATDINESTQRIMSDKLRVVLADATDAGWGIPKIQEEILAQISGVLDVRKSDYERERIARTEMHKASELGNTEGALQSGLTLVKGWLAALDGRERDTHREAHMQYQANPIPAESLFQVGYDTMREPGTGRLPEENINCRCTKIWIEVEP